MLRTFATLAISATMLLLTGCASKTTIIDPATTKTNIRSSHSVSSEEMRQVTLKATKKIMGHPKFTNFLKKYAVEKKDETAIPVLKLAAVRNETNDPDLNTSEMTDMLEEALMDSGKVDVTLAEGADRVQSIAGSRDLENDDNFDQSTVAQKGTLQAARLVLRPKVISNEVKDGSTKVVTRTFVIDVADIKTGLIMFRVTEQLGFMKEKTAFGW